GAGGGRGGAPPAANAATPAGNAAPQAGGAATPAAAPAGGRGGRGGGGGGRGGAGGRAGGGARGGAGAPAANRIPATFRLTPPAAATLLGKPLEGLALGTTGGTVNANLQWSETPSDFGRNVIGIVRGSDPALRGEYVAIGAHNDHNGIRFATGTNLPFDH